MKAETNLRGVNRFRSYMETAEICGLPYSTLKRLIAEGRGPKVTSFGERLRRISDADREDWLRLMSTAQG